jgi:hypothetical protein
VGYEGVEHDGLSVSVIFRFRISGVT